VDTSIPLRGGFQEGEDSQRARRCLQPWSLAWD